MSESLTLRQDGHDKVTMNVILGGQLDPDLMLVQVSNRFYDPEEGRSITESATIRLTAEQQDSLFETLSRFRTARIHS